MAPSQITVLVLIFDGVNTLDVNGPLEVLGNYGLRQSRPDDPAWCPFKILIASKSGTPVTCFEFVQVGATMDFASATKLIQAKQVDVLITPGAALSSTTSQLINSNDAVFEPMRAFLNLDSSDKQRWMISICVGALLNAHAGAFDGREATTHFLALSRLEAYSKGAKVVRKRWVDGGVTDQGIRIVSSGGISCGIDCMLWFVSQVLDDFAAMKVAWMMDYNWLNPQDVSPTPQW